MASLLAAREHGGTGKWLSCWWPPPRTVPRHAGMEAVQDRPQQAGLCLPAAAGALWSPPWNISVLN